MIQLKVNGAAESFDGEPEMPLLWYLRDVLGRSRYTAVVTSGRIPSRDSVHARIKAGKLTEDMDASSILDSLDTVELTMELEELGLETTVPIKSVGDLLWLFKALDLKRARDVTAL